MSAFRGTGSEARGRSSSPVAIKVREPLTDASSFEGPLIRP